MFGKERVSVSEDVEGGTLLCRRNAELSFFFFFSGNFI